MHTASADSGSSIAERLDRHPARPPPEPPDLWNCKTRKLRIEVHEHNEQGEVVGVFAAARDVTARRRAEQALRQSEQRYRALVEATAQMVWTANGQGEASDMAAWRAFTGQTAAEVKGGGWAGALHPEDRERAAAAWSQAVAAGAVCDMQFRVRRQDGVYRHFAWRGVPVLKADGSVREWVGLCADITDKACAETNQRQTAEELGRAKGDLAQFAYVASHDLQEPLRAVAGWVQLLQQHCGPQLDAQAQEYIRRAVDGAARMQTLIRDLLAFARVSTLGQPFEFVNSAAVLQAALANLSAAIRQRQAEVHHDPLPTVKADPSQLTQLLENLISNAIKFCAQDRPRVRVMAQARGAAWQFAVRDNGIGIEPKYFERVFGLCQQLHGRREYPGTGIGLAICKKIVERHGGRIWVESEPGRGSVFYFTLPTGDDSR